VYLLFIVPTAAFSIRGNGIFYNTVPAGDLFVVGGAGNPVLNRGVTCGAASGIDLGLVVFHGFYPPKIKVLQ
jgi:hypothetical protein